MSAATDSAQPTWLPDVGLAVAVTVAGLTEAVLGPTWLGSSMLCRITIALAMGLAAGTFRLAPGIALLTVWGGCLLQVLTSSDVMLVQLVSMLVAFGAARYGDQFVLWMSGLSIPVGALIALAFVLDNGPALSSALGQAVPRPNSLQLARPLVLGLTALLLLLLPWFLGLVLRILDQVRRSRLEQATAEAERERAETERRQAEEIAGLRAEQARLAHDVHDVVGHSLAVILAQAESAQFLPPDDPERLKATMANIASSARQSLRDVRVVLSTEQQNGEQDPIPGGLDRLIDGVRGAGHEISDLVEGTPRPLPPEIEVVAFRVLQEMLTNAIKHGTRDGAITVRRSWGQDLTLSVANPYQWDASAGSGGLGTDSMNARLLSVGGRLEIFADADAGLFTATAVLPVRAVTWQPDQAGSRW